MFATLCLRNAGRDRHGVRRASPVLDALDQHLVEHAVIVAGEHHDLVAPGHGARDAHRGHHRFRAGVAERHRARCRSSRRTAARLRRPAASAARSRSPCPSCSSIASTTKVGAWPKHDRAKAVDEIDVFVAVNVPDARAARAVADQRVDQLLPFRSKPAAARGSASVGRAATVRCLEPPVFAVKRAASASMCRPAMG